MEAQEKLLRISLLGLARLESEAGPLPRLATQRSTSLFAYLVLHPGREHGREQLAELFWPERPPANGRRSLHTALWQIKHVLKAGGLEPAHYLVTAGSTVAWHNAACWLDVAEFEAAVSTATPAGWQQAISLYRGLLLEGLYDDWLLEERYRLEERYLFALSQLAAVHYDQRAYALALQTARRLLNSDSLREDGHRLVMAALYQTGQRPAALQQYALCARLLAEELGAEPSAETKAVHQAILEETMAYLDTAAAALPLAPLTATPLANEPQANPFTGRTAELAVLQNWWGQQRPIIRLLLGEAGVGKTSLAQEFAAGLRWRGVQVGWGRCYSFENILPYQAVGDALRSLAAASPNWLNQLPAWAAGELSRLLPEEGELRGTGENSGEFKPKIQNPKSKIVQDQRALFEAVYQALAHLAGQQAVLLVLEDFHWATESTGQLLEYLAQRLAGRHSATAFPIQILMTARPEELSPAVTLQLFRRLSHERFLTDLTLHRFDQTTLATWLAGWSRLSRPAVEALADWLYRETEGNPFYVTEMVAALFENGQLVNQGEAGWAGQGLRPGQTMLTTPRSIQDFIMARVDRLPAATREALQVAAVAGREFDAAIVQAAWQRGEDETLAALDDLLRGQFIRDSLASTGRDYDFGHHKIQETVYDHLSSSSRRRQHRRVGLAMEATYGEKAAPELLHHFRQAQDAGRIVEWGVRAGRQAADLLATADAIDYFSQADGWVERANPSLETQASLYAGLAKAARERGLVKQAVYAAGRWLAVAQAAGSIEWEAEARLWAGVGAVDSGDLPTAIDQLRQARHLAEAVQHPLLPQLLCHLGAVMGWSGDWDSGLPILAEAAELGTQQGQPRYVARAQTITGLAWLAKNQLGRSLAAMQASLASLKGVNDPYVETLVLHNLGELCAPLRLLSLCRQVLSRLDRLCRERGLETDLALLTLGNLHYALEEYDEAEALMRRAAELSEQHGNYDKVVEIFNRYHKLLLERGKPAEALAVAERHISLSHSPGNYLAYCDRGLARLALGQLEQAAADLEPAVQTWSSLGRDHHLLWPAWHGLGRLYLALGNQPATHTALHTALSLVNNLAATLTDYPLHQQEFLQSRPVLALYTSLASLSI